MAAESDPGHDLSGTVSEKTGKQKYETEILLKRIRERKLLHEELENRQTVKKQSAYSLFLVVVQNARMDIKITKNVTCFIRKNKNSRGTENKYNPILYVNSKIYHQKM